LDAVEKREMPVPSENIHIFALILMDPCNCSGDLIEEDLMAGSRSTHDKGKKCAHSYFKERLLARPKK
jgi:hypothetical protein